jgi:hypothetical protein
MKQAGRIRKYSELADTKMDQEALKTIDDLKRMEQIDMSLVDPSGKGHYSYDFFKDDMREFLNTLSDKDAKKAKDYMNQWAKQIWGPNYEQASTADISRLNEYRKKIDREINFERDATKPRLWKQDALLRMRHAIDNVIVKDVADPKYFKKMGRLYGMGTELKRGLRNRIKKQKTGFSPSMGSPSDLVKLLGIAQSHGGKIGLNAAKIGENAPKWMGIPFRRTGQLLDQGESEMTDDMFEDEPVDVNLNPAPPQSMNIMSPMEKMEFNFPEKLIKSKLPRNTKDFIAKKDLFKYKVAQELEGHLADQAAQMGLEDADSNEIRQAAVNKFQMITEVIDNGSEKDIHKMLPKWITEFNHMYEDDEWNRINNVVPVPMRPILRDEIRKNQKLNNTQRIAKLDLLHRTGEYIDEPENEGLA